MNNLFPTSLSFLWVPTSLDAACGGGNFVVVGGAVVIMFLLLYTFNIMLCPWDNKTVLMTKETLPHLSSTSIYFSPFLMLFI